MLMRVTHHAALYYPAKVVESFTRLPIYIVEMYIGFSYHTTFFQKAVRYKHCYYASGCGVPDGMPIQVLRLISAIRKDAIYGNCNYSNCHNTGGFL